MSLVLVSGNNLVCVGDVSRRAVFCRLDAEVERPDTREFDFDCHQEVLDQRPKLVVAGLTMLRAFIHAGRPVTLKPMGSFDDWAWIRGALVWLGCADPADTRQSSVESDPRQGELFAVMQLWDTAFGSGRTDVASVGTSTGADMEALQIKLIDVACRQRTWSGRSVGWWLRRYKDQVVAGQCFQCEPGTDGLRWRLHTATPQPDVGG